MSEAKFSADRVYRYRLERRISATPTGSLCFILLNPSTADETQNDPTIRRCMGYAAAWGYSRLVVVNLFAYRATDPRELRKVNNPWGPDNGMEIMRAAQAADLVVAGWGAHGALHNAGNLTISRLRLKGVDTYALGLTKAGQPVHPLYQRADLKPALAL